LLSFSVHAQTYPTKPVRIISATPSGTSGDIAIRLASPLMSNALGQPVIVDSRPAAGGQVAAVAVKQSAPDGYTALISASAPMVTNRYLLKNVPYDTLVDFTPVSKMISVPSIFVISAALPVNSVAEFVDYAKKFPGKLAFGSTGNGTAFHMIGESISIETGIRMLHVPYAAQGLAQPVADVASDRIQALFPTVASLGAQAKTGKVKILAVFDKTRQRQIPEVPAINELYPKYTILPSWFGLLAPAGLPSPMATRLQTELRAALNNPEVSAKLDALGTTPVGNAPAEFTEEIRADIAAVGRIAKALGIEPQ
jgi:tripartite-type tricarboxylate transporter receptor subunit TctC